MIKTKGMDAGKVGDNYPMGATVTGTEKVSVGGQMPARAALPTMADAPAYMNQAPSAGVVMAQDTAALPMFSESAGYTDTGAKVGGM